jgi:ATP-dependent exoDNAse (exonuclease V) beta subunit
MVKEDFLSDLNPEKQEIIKTEGNVLVIANPGTGKTKLLQVQELERQQLLLRDTLTS